MESGFVVTWDVDSADQSGAGRVKCFTFGKTVRSDGRERRYPGFVWKEGVRYLGQSSVFVLPHRLPEIRDSSSRTGLITTWSR